MFRCHDNLFAILLLCFHVFSFLVLTVSSQNRLPPGVPPRTNNVENDGGIKFHDPNEFRNQEPQKVTGVNPGLKQTNEQPQKPQPAGSSPHAKKDPRHPRHQHGAKINFDDKDAREHMKAHNKEKDYVKIDELSQPQLIMQHFRNFDLDKNGKIDGLEILKAAANMNAEHEHEDENEEGEEGETYDHFDFMEMAEETDETLRNYDENNDGYIHYGEFYRNHKKTLDSASKTPGAGG